MSEYQYYEFQAVDRPLTKDEVAALRAISSRAEITPRRFTNVYHYGDFRGNPRELMERYFDGFVYVANWGTRQLMLRLPRPLLDPKPLSPYLVDNYVEAHVTRDHVILDIVLQTEEPQWVDDEEAAAWLSALLPLRTELADGDWRCLYLAWLSYAQMGILADEEAPALLNDAEDYEDDEYGDELEAENLDATEPPVPPGLAIFSDALQTLADFLRLDVDLIAVAAERSAPLQRTQPTTADLQRWIATLPSAEKDPFLLRLMEGDAPHARAELLRRYRAATPSANPAHAATSGGRTVRELLAAAREHGTARRRAEAERQARERAAYLDTIAPREEELWRLVSDLVEQRQAGPYAQAVEILTDLRDLADRNEESAWFVGRLRTLRTHHARKTGFIQRLDNAGLHDS